MKTLILINNIKNEVANLSLEHASPQAQLEAGAGPAEADRLSRVQPSFPQRGAQHPQEEARGRRQASQGALGQRNPQEDR